MENVANAGNVGGGRRHNQSAYSSHVPTFDEGAAEGLSLQRIASNQYQSDYSEKFVHSTRSRSSITNDWNEYATSRSLDDYYFALNKLGKHAAKGYMHVMVTTGEG